MPFSSPTPSISSAGVKSILSALQQMGIDIQAVLNDVNLSTLNLDDSDLRISCTHAFEIYNAGQNYWRRENFGLQHGLLYQPFMLGIVGHLLTTANTGLDALQSFIRYQTAFGEGLRLDISGHVDPTDSQPAIAARLWIHPTMKDKVNSSIVDSYFVALMNCVHLLTGRNNQLTQVKLRRPQPDSSEEYERVFDCPILFSQPEDKLILSSKQLEEPLLSANPELHLLLSQKSQSILSSIKSEQDLPNRVRHEIERCIDGSKIDLDRIAQGLRVNSRTLQRRLKEKGQQFQQILDEVRREFATTQLKNGSISIDEQAYLLGFSEPSVYRKSFKRWTGKTPTEFRKSLNSDKKHPNNQ